MTDYKHLKLLPAKWVTGFPKAPGMRLKVRSAEATDYTNELHRRVAEEIPHGQVESIGKMALRKIYRRTEVDALLDLLLVDWSGVLSDGEPLRFSRAAARKLIFEHKLFRWWVLGAAFDVDSGGLRGHVAHGLC